jgi:hypothetical protein
VNARRYIALLVALALSLALIVGAASSATPGRRIVDEESEPGITLVKDSDGASGDDDRWGTTSVWTGDSESPEDEEENSGSTDSAARKGPELVTPRGVLRDGIRIFVGTVWIFLTSTL